MADRSVRVRLVAEIGQYRAAMQQASKTTSDFAHRVTADSKAAHQVLEQYGRGALIAGGAVAAGLGLAARAAIQWESAWAGVTKTVDGTEAQLADLEDGLREMARELPATHGEIAAVAEAAGALGIATPAVESFTRTMIDLGETTDLTADQAATAFARIANIMGTPQTEFERMGSTIVDLGNRLAATESEIAEMALRIAGAGAQIELSESQVLGFAGALSSVGIEAEAGGSSISRVFVDIATAADQGGAKLDAFAEVAGVSGAEFAAAFEEDAAGAIVTFIEGLGQLQAQGGSVFAVLDELGLSEIRVRDALLRAAAAGDLFRESLDIGSRAWAENTALAAEAAQRYGTTASQLDVMRNNVVSLGVDLGSTLLPPLTEAVDVVSSMARGFGELPGPVHGATTTLAGLVTAGLGVSGVAAVMKPKVDNLKGSLNQLGAGGQFVAANLGRMGIALGAAGVAVAAVSYVLGQQAQDQAAAQASVEEYTAAILDQNGALQDNVDLSTANQLTHSETGRLLREAGVDFALVADQIRNADAAFGEAFSPSGSDLVSFDTNVRALREDIEEGTVALTPFVEELLRLADEGELTGDQIRGLAHGVADLVTNYGDAQLAAEVQNAFLEDTGLTARTSGQHVDTYADTVEAAAAAQQALAAALDGATDAFRRQYGELLSLTEADVNYQAAIDGLIDSVATNTRTLDANTAEGRANIQAALEAGGAIADLIGLRYGETGSVQAATDAGLLYVENLRNQLRQAGFTEASIDTLIATMHLTPAEIDTQVRLLGHDTAATFLADYSEELEALPDEEETEIRALIDDGAIAEAEAALRQLSEPRYVSIITRLGYGSPDAYERSVDGHAAGGLVVAHAAGGIVPDLGNGPGDTVPAMLTKGEYVIREPAVRALGTDFLDRLNYADMALASPGVFVIARNALESVFA